VGYYQKRKRIKEKVEHVWTDGEKRRLKTAA
jgi:hypothetical protein